MTPSCLPLISETDYPGFQRRIKELIDVSYQEWRQDHHKAVSYRRSRNGSREVAITPVEFELCGLKRIGWTHTWSSFGPAWRTWRIAHRTARRRSREA